FYMRGKLPVFYILFSLMEPQETTKPAGQKLKELRESLGLSVREVERRSERLALLKKNSEYYLSRGWLTDIENGTHVPSIFKIYSMATFYKRGWADLVALFDMHVSELRRDQARFDLPNTVLLDEPAVPDSETIALPIRPRGDLSLEQTSLLSKLVAVWGDVPIPLVQQLNLRKSLYGFIGLSDRTLSPLIPPGSFVQIDVRQRKITTRPSATAFDRAIYFVELRGAYACGWCELKDGHLIVLAHPNSGAVTRQFEYPREAEIVGRVTGVAMRIAEDAEEHSR
ncbi:MAG: helix-turn-helix transcriptional regulator, partial [Candidatus Acidiferrales bacterium]